MVDLNEGVLSDNIMTDRVVVEVFPWLSRALGKESKVVLTENVSPQGEELRSLLERLALTHDGFGAVIYDVKRGVVYDGVVIFVNDQRTDPDLNGTINGGDRITVTPLYSGG